MADDVLLDSLLARVRGKDRVAGAEALTVARALVTEYIASANVTTSTTDPVTGIVTETTTNPVPLELVDPAVLATAAEYLAIAKAPNGVLNQQFADSDGMQAVPIRVSGDPLRPVRPLLATWIGGLTT